MSNRVHPETENDLNEKSSSSDTLKDEIGDESLHDINDSVKDSDSDPPSNNNIPKLSTHSIPRLSTFMSKSVRFESTGQELEGRSINKTLIYQNSISFWKNLIKFENYESFEETHTLC